MGPLQLVKSELMTVARASISSTAFNGIPAAAGPFPPPMPSWPFFRHLTDGSNATLPPVASSFDAVPRYTARKGFPKSCAHNLTLLAEEEESRGESIEPSLGRLDR